MKACRIAAQRSGMVRAAALREPRLELCEGLLDRVEIRTVGRKVEQPAPRGLDRVLHAGHLVGWQVVHDDDVVRLQHRDEGLGDIAAEARAVRGSIKQRGGAQPARAQGDSDGRGLLMPARGCEPAALAAWRPTVAPRHVGGSGRLVQEHEPVRIELGLRLKPSFAGGPYVRALLLSCVRRPFFQVIPCRWKKRDSPLVLVCTPCSAKRSRSSRRKRRGSCSEVARISAAWASMACEV